jgi:Asp-tRNA(Asn)/Glu-tRNA(Gln) amidotransferase A subunit family amidase
VVAEAAAALAERGARIVEDRPAMLDRAVTLYSELRETDRLQDVRRLLAGHEEDAGEDVRAAIAAVVDRERDLARVDLARVWEERDRIRTALLSFLERVPVLLMPVATVPPFDESKPLTVEGRDQAMWDVLAPCRLISLLGVPAASVPIGRSEDGLPIGVQVVGRPFREDEVLAVAGMLMEARSPSGAPRAEVAG